MIIGIILWLQYVTPTSILEGGLIALCIILIAYPFTTYLSKALLQKAMQNRQMLVFIAQFLLVSVIIAVFIIILFQVFDVLEKNGVFDKSELFLEENSLLYDYIVALLISIFLNFGFCGLRFFEQNIKLQKELVDSRFQILLAQINPHFMFNVLNHVNVLIRKEPDLASSLLVQYTNILRYQLYSGKKDSVSIKQEVEFLKDFIDIEKIRWKNNLDVKCSWDVEDESTLLSPLLFFTFIENAFKHVSRSKTEKGHVHIDLRQKEEILELIVENSKYADNQIVLRKEESGIGLENIKKRLDILYPKRYKLLISETETSYSVSLSIKS